jgi:hypothetical protein
MAVSISDGQEIRAEAPDRGAKSHRADAARRTNMPAHSGEMQTVHLRIISGPASVHATMDPRLQSHSGKRAHVPARQQHLVLAERDVIADVVVKQVRASDADLQIGRVASPSRTSG